MLAHDVGYNITPEEVFAQYPAIGRFGTFISDYRAFSEILGPVRGGGRFTVGLFTQASKNQISYLKVWRLSRALGLERTSLFGGFRFTRVSGITDMAPRSPLAGNRYFLGSGKGLPNGAPEVVISPIPTNPWP
jgi:hypothetical protein